MSSIFDHYASDDPPFPLPKGKPVTTHASTDKTPTPDEIAELLAQVAGLRRALEFYASAYSYRDGQAGRDGEDGEWVLDIDENGFLGAVASAALRGEYPPVPFRAPPSDIRDAVRKATAPEHPEGIPGSGIPDDEMPAPRIEFEGVEVVAYRGKDGRVNVEVDTAGCAQHAPDGRPSMRVRVNEGLVYNVVHYGPKETI